ncbi:MAG TPA: hypothetical protein VJN62_14240 [Gemmatimonadales bacterium]|nr:hypothetical protein [Gemmatimonadales bacterium]
MRRTSVLVHDQIVNQFDVRPALAPAFSVTAGLPLDNPWRASAALDVSTSELQREDQGGGTQPITHLTTAAVTVGLSRALKPWLSGSVRIGAIKYLPSQDLGLFQAGGPFFPFAQIAFDVIPPFAARYGLGLEVNADVHKFITDALRTEGFTESRGVVRVALGVSWTPGSRP